MKKITNDIIYIGVKDNDIDLFENQYQVPNGITYNSYIIKDEKTVIMDTVDKRKTEEWWEKLEQELGKKEPDYLVVSHLEPDHAYNTQALANKYPNMKIIGNQRTFNIMPQFFNIANLEDRKIVVNEGDVLNLGKHKLQFFMAPMVHWPEVMVTYEQTEKILFSADAFGKFGTLDNEEWLPEARRYYINIVGKYGMQVQALLKKLKTLEVKTICPLHGPILKENLEYYIEKYNTWSSYKPEEKGILLAVASIYGNTYDAVKEMQKMLKEENVTLIDLTREDISKAVGEAFKYDKLIVAASSYDSGLFPPMENFLRRLKNKNYQNRTVGIIENGSWAPSAGKCMKELLLQMKNIDICKQSVTIRSRLDEESKKQMEEIVKEILSK
jgi:flavorubredoxin